MTVNIDFIVPARKFCHHEFEGNVPATVKRVFQLLPPLRQWMVIAATNDNDVRSFCSKEVACEPDGGISTISELVKYSVSLVVDVSDVYWVIPSRPITVRTLQIRESEVKVVRRQGFHSSLEVLPES